MNAELRRDTVIAVYAVRARCLESCYLTVQNPVAVIVDLNRGADTVHSGRAVLGTLTVNHPIPVAINGDRGSNSVDAICTVCAVCTVLTQSAEGGFGPVDDPITVGADLDRWRNAVFPVFSVFSVFSGVTLVAFVAFVAFVALFALFALNALLARDAFAAERVLNRAMAGRKQRCKHSETNQKSN